MKTLTKNREKQIIQLMAQEFLEYRLGIEASRKNIQYLVNHIIQFERKIEKKSFKKIDKHSSLLFEKFILLEIMKINDK